MKSYLVAIVCCFTISSGLASNRSIAQPAGEEAERLSERTKQVTSLIAEGYKFQFFTDYKSGIPRDILLEILKCFRERVPNGKTSIEDLHEFKESKLKEFIEGLGGSRQDWVDVLILQDDETLRVQSGNGVTIRNFGVEQQYDPEVNRIAVYQKYTSQSIPGMKTLFPKFPLPNEVGEWKSAALGNQFVLSTFKKKVEWLIEYDKSSDFITKLWVGVNPSLMVQEAYFDQPGSSNGVAVPRLVFEVLHRAPKTIEDTSSIMGFIAYVFNSVEINPGLDPKVFELIVPDGTKIFRYSGGADAKDGVRQEKAKGPTIVVKAE